MIASMLRRSLRLAWVAIALAACTFQRPTSDVPTSYDFGPPPAHARSNPAIPGTLLVTPVRAPAWLDDTGIVYRLLYEDASRPQVYAMSRWAALPAALVTERLHSRFAAAAQGVVAPGYSARSDYTLRVELDDFSQHFTAPAESRVLLRGRATLLSTEGRRVIAQREFDISRPAAGNAPGAVKALTQATDAFIEELVKLTAESVRARGGAAAEQGSPKP